MFGTVVHINTPDILHQRNTEHITHKNHDTQHSFDDCHKRGAPDTLLKQRRNIIGQHHKNTNRKCNRKYHHDCAEHFICLVLEQSVKSLVRRRLLSFSLLIKGCRKIQAPHPQDQ